jgi:serine-type D-Ala-D-Ala carboxypeptidase/endopeptidase (penicillin-binding protein 4)
MNAHPTAREQRPCAVHRMVACAALVLLPHLALAQVGHLTPGDLVRSIDQILDQPQFENAFWGALVIDLNTGERIYARNPNKSFLPASLNKLFTSAAALDRLDPEFRYRTELLAEGPVHDGVLQGALIVRGAGDPTIGAPVFGISGPDLFRQWADSIRNAGIYHIRGDIIGDDNVFDDVPLGTGWSWDDEPYAYAAEVSGLAMNENTVSVVVTAQRPGAPGDVRLEPETDYVQVINRTVTLPRDSSLARRFDRSRGTNIIRLSTRIPAGRTDTASITVHNPTRYFVHVLRSVLLGEGISVGGRAVDVDDVDVRPDYLATQRVAVHHSPPLREIVRETNKRSQNLYAEHLLKTLGAIQAVETGVVGPGTAPSGARSLLSFAARVGADTSRIRIADGSGLSRMNLTTPETTARLLTYIWQFPDNPVRDSFIASLPVGGVDGTLAGRFQSPPALGNVRAKTGTLSGVSGLGGYVASASGTPFAFVLICNHHTLRADAVRAAQDAVVERLSRYRR